MRQGPGGDFTTTTTTTAAAMRGGGVSTSNGAAVSTSSTEMEHAAKENAAARANGGGRRRRERGRSGRDDDDDVNGDDDENDVGGGGDKRGKSRKVNKTPAVKTVKAKTVTVTSSKTGISTVLKPSTWGSGSFTKEASALKSPASASVARQRPTNNQLLYRINFNWEHYTHNVPAHARKMLPSTTEACPSVTSAFLQTLKALDAAESSRVDNPRNILQLLSVNTRRTKVVALNTGTHRVPEELRRHQLSDKDGNAYSTNLDRNRYGNDDNYLFTVTRFNLQALELCPLLAQVEIIGTKGNSANDILLSTDQAECTCGGSHRTTSSHWTVPAFVTPAQMPKQIPKSTLAAKDRSRKRSRQSMSSADEKPWVSQLKARESLTPERASEAGPHGGMGVLLDALTSVGGIPMSPVPAARKRISTTGVMSPARPVRGIRQVELDLGAINEDTTAAQQQIAQATLQSIHHIPDEMLRAELHSAVARTCELHMTASAYQQRQFRAEREAEEYKTIVSNLEALLNESQSEAHEAKLQLAKMRSEVNGVVMSHNENDAVIQTSALLAHKLIGMQQLVAALASRVELLSGEKTRCAVEEMLRAEMAAHLQTKKALLRAEISLAAYAAAEATCDEEVWRKQYVASAQANLEQAAYAATTSSDAQQQYDPLAARQPGAPQGLISKAVDVSFKTPADAVAARPEMSTAPSGIKAIAMMADAAAASIVDPSHLPPKTPIGANPEYLRNAFISPP